MNNSNDNQQQNYNSQQDGDRIDLNNYMADPNRRQELKKRLYDSGISNIPMPSVKRPIEENISSKPYSAKMNPSKIQNTSPLKKGIEKLNKNIINQLKMSYEEAAVQESKYKGEGTAEYYKSQHIMVPPPQFIQGMKKGPERLVPKLGSTNQGPALQGLSSTNRKLLNKGPKPAQLPSLGNYGASTMGQSQLDNMRLLQGPPSMVMAGFEGGYSLGQKNLELARSKFLVDKLTGKLPEELRGGMSTKLPPISGEDRDALESRGSISRTGLKKDDDDDEVKKDTVTQQKWSDLDKYIELLLDSKSEEETVFVYLNPNPNSDPYDLLVGSYQDRTPQKYYTLSGKGLTLYENDMPIEFLSLGQWLIERDSYNHIKELDFFKKFKKWKFMRMWKKTIKHMQRMKAQNALEEKLFILQDHFSTHLFTHRKYMIEMEKKRFVDTLQSSETNTIEEFANRQFIRTKQITEDIKFISDKSRINIRECISEVVGELRTRIVSEIALDEERKKNNPIQSSNTITTKRKASSSVFEKLGFPDGMTYGHRSSLRKECSRFLRFAYLVDFLSLEALANIYTGSVSDMIERLKSLNDECDMEEVMNKDYDDQQGATGASGGQDPLFFVSVQLCDEVEIPQHEVKKIQIEEFTKTSNIEDFDPIVHLEILEPVEANEEDEEEEGEPEDPVVVPIFKEVVPAIEKYWLRMEPDQEDYIEILVRTFSTGLEKIKNFERWSKHNEFTIYADALEDWDDIVGDSWDEPDSLNLEPRTWIQEHPLHTNQKQLIQNIINDAFDKMKFFLTRFQPILEKYWRNKQINLKILMEENLRNPIESISNTISLFNYQHEYFSQRLPSKAEIGLILLDSKSARTKIQPTPNSYKAQIEGYIPVILKERNIEAQKWLKEQIRNLSLPVTDVEEFVQQDEFYKFTEKGFQDVRDRVDMFGQIYAMLKEFQMKGVKKEDQDAFNESLANIATLSQLVQNVESTQEGNKELFKKTLNELVPKLDKEISELYEEAQHAKFLDGKSEMFEMIKILDGIEVRFKELEARSIKYNKWQEVLDTQPTVFENLDGARDELGLRSLMWHSLDKWNVMSEAWLKTPFANVDAGDIADKAERYFKTCMRLEKQLDPNPIQIQLKEKVEEFKEAMPIVKAFRNERLQENHWAEIKALINKDFEIENEDFTLKAMIDLKVNAFKDEIVAISTQATQEYSLREEIKKIDDLYRNTLWDIEYEEKCECYLLKDMTDVYQALDDSLSNINMILGSRFVKPLRAEAEQWKGWIMTLSDMVDQWWECQKKWRYLENIFKAPDIKKSLSEETKKFESVDKFFKNLMGGNGGAEKQKKCIYWAKQKPQTLDNLIANNAILDEVEKRLKDYMELKRGAFPRFYFLSDDELIDILANSTNLDIIQGHLKTCFDNIVRIEIEEGIEIKAMFSNEKEKVDFKKPLKARGPVETWLMQLQEEMVATLSYLLKQGVSDYEDEKKNKNRVEFVHTHKGQIVATVCQIKWCQNTALAIDEQAADPSSLDGWLTQNVKQIDDLIAQVRGDLSDIGRKIIVALVTVDVHARDIVEEMKALNVSSTAEFKWVQQLRYYWEDETDLCVIKQVSASLNYAYEYMGATSRLVITPLTDRCWITISNALHIKLGANPAGPAGTGKTESTKDLAKALAIQCIVFNCSDQVDYLMMGRLFSGLCQQGCWTCLDEFNRIKIEVLSVIAQQLLSIRTALLAEKKNFNFEDHEIDLKVEFGCHVTMNPGYAGRTELPDNLQVLFRPVAMMIPDYGLIAEIMLGAEGFANAKILSKKMTKLYSLSSEQLSQQDHYDFGLRAVKSVLVMAGSLKRANPDLIEDSVLIRAMRDANVPKFLVHDLPLFAAIIQDLFPSIEITANDYGKLEVTIREIIVSQDLQPEDGFVTKVIQLYETFNVRFGVMIVGPTGAGKTRCYEVLQNTFITMRERGDPNQVFQNVKKIVLNPKSISMGEMYGEVNEVSQEWFDGLASKVMRNAAQETDEDRTWVVFDGPVDALWIENMNTVLDDNMTLCLANGQRIKLRSQMKMLFEVQDLSVASPATVSRCGMVYMTAYELGWRPYVKTWIKTYFTDEEEMSEALKEHLWVNFDAVIDVGLDFIYTRCSEGIVTTELQQVVSLCNFLEYFLHDEMGFKGTDEEKKKQIDCVMSFAFAWGMGGSLDHQSKERFDSVVKDQFKAAQYPPAFTVFDYWYDLKAKDKVFKPWTTKVLSFNYDKDMSYFDLMVPTTDTTKYAYCLEVLLKISKPIFITGGSGTGKSAVISNKLSLMKEKDNIVPININMSAQTTSQRTQQSIEEKLERTSRTAFGPPSGKKIAVFVDDINMPAVEFYGAQPPIELLRLFVDRQGMYQRGEWNWKDVNGTTLIACAAPPSGGRAVLTLRFSRRFNMLCMPEPTPGTLTTIFSSILKEFLKTGFQEKVKNLQEAAIQSTIDIYVKIQQDLRPTPAKFHYLFNLRDVSKVVQGICMVKPVSCGSDELFSKLWVNECFRVFYDRLINEDDRKWFKNIILELLGKNFKMAADANDIFVENKIRFGDLLKLDSPVQYYEYIDNKAKLLKILHGGLDEYNMSNSSKMNLVLFEDALEHILRITRVLKQPRGHIMLIGVGGSGKQSLIKLCTFMRNMEFRMIEITKGFNIDSFKEKMKEYMKESGINGQGISYTLTDTQIIDETQIENLNNLLNTGEIPNLMLPEDREEITNGVRPHCIAQKILDTVDNIAALFVSRIREYLHICLCMSPVGDTLRVRCRQFPSLVNCCTLDWFARWPEKALLFVSREFLKELPDVDDEIKEGLSVMCMKIHISVEEISTKFWNSLRRRVYTTPKSYLDLISLYLQVLEKKRYEYHQNKSRLANGLSKLNEANKEIAELNVKLTEMKPILIKKNEELKVALVKVNADKEVADAKEKVVSAEAEVVNKKAAEAKAIADDAQNDLDAAEPELKAAAKAVRDLDKNSIVEIKSFTTPPEQVKFVMECVMILLGKKTDWPTVKQTLSDVNGFMSMLMDYNVEKTSEKVWKKARDGYISKPQFEPAAVKKVSLAASALCIWSVASSKYQTVTKKVAPKKAKHAEVTAVLNEAQAELQIKLDEVQKVKDAVAILEANCQKMMDEKEELENNMNTSNLRMGRAEKLVVLLKDEGIRWKATVEIIGEQIIKLVGNVFLSCACISYFGAFTGQYRDMLTKQWIEGCLEKEIPTNDDFNLSSIMGDPVEIRNWGIAGLPSDSVSVENGILTTMAERYALCIDPQQQANKWIKNLYKTQNLCKLKFGHKDFLRDTITCVRNGRPLLVEDVEENVDPALDPVLLKQQYKTEAGIMQIRLGDANHDFDEHFRFYMTTKMPNPHYIPEICIKVTLINFTVTFEGLQQQMLGDVVIAEKPEIEEKRDGIVLQMAADSQMLKDLENNILKLLDGATVLEILDADTLIIVLQDSKKTSGEINERMEIAKVVEVEINETRNMYTNVAIRGSILYFVIADLAGIDPMYQNSLAYVKTLFNTAIAQSPAKETIEERLAVLIDKITRMIYTNVSRGLFECDKIIYSFLIITSILRQAKQIDEGIWNILLRGPTVFSPEEAAAKLDTPDNIILPPIPWDLICSADIRSAGQFEGLSQSIVDKWEEWKAWGLSDNPFATTMPDGFNERLSPFDRLLLVKSFRNELILVSIAEYIIGEMGKFYVEPPSTSMDVIFETMDICTPLIYVLTQGADPTSILFNFAKAQNMMERLYPISLGQGQGPKATKLISTAMADGNWVMLQNCHLLESWMSNLEKIVLDFAEQKETTNPDFRLFLTSMPSQAFPVAVLQNSSKLTVEPPRGMKANIKRSYIPITQEILEETSKPEAWRKLLFSLSFFHAIIQERRKFGPLGWNKKYSFNDSDLDTTFVMLRLFLEQDEIPWEALTFIIGHINYGGRVTDDNDRVCLMSTLAKYCCPDALKDGFKFSLSGVYANPNDGNLAHYNDYIDSLPLNDPPEIYGLHGNANIKYQDIVSNLCIDTILSIQPRLVAAEGGLSPDEIVQGKSRELLGQLPEQLDQKEGKKELFAVNAQGLIPSLSTVLVQEMTKFNRLIKKMKQSLIDIDLAIQGFIVMSEELDSMYLKIQNNQVPDNWAKVGYPSLKPLSSWYKDFIIRIDFFRQWMMEGNPASYWLPGFFFPQGFMTGVLQTHSRQYKIAIDKLAYSFEFLEAEEPEEIEEPPVDGVYISGLFMDGGRWDREGAIITDQHQAIMFDRMPIIHFNPKEDYKPESDLYLCPLYKTSLRQGVLSTTGLSTNFVLHVASPSNEAPAFWVGRGTAMLCMLDD